MVSNTLESVLPNMVIAVMITMEISPAMRPYSMAVAPHSSLRSLRKKRNIVGFSHAYVGWPSKALAGLGKADGG
jgi:hypothetical protein